MAVYPFSPREAEQVLHITSIFRTSVFLYIGPDQLLPLLSAFGAALGFILIIWHRLVALLRKAWHFFKKDRTPLK